MFPFKPDRLLRVQGARLGARIFARCRSKEGWCLDRAVATTRVNYSINQQMSGAAVAAP